MALLSGNALKLIAAFCMVCDHVGLMFFPGATWLRIIGRLAYPIFAYMIAEGCKYTRSRKRYFFTLFGLATACQVVYFLFDGSMYLSILFTFSLSILGVYALDAFKESTGLTRDIRFTLAITGIWILNQIFTIDYGFWGCMVPVFASLPTNTRYDRPPIRALALGLGLLLLALDLGGIQYFSLLAVPLMLLYSGRRGKGNLKYFFYIFYPLHLAALQGLQMLLWSK